MAATPIQDAAPFLADAAHLLKTSAPETSAHLMLHCTTLLQRNGTSLSSTHLQHSCGTCGEIMVPGYDASNIRLERSNAGKRKRRAHQARERTTSQPAAQTLKKQITCGRCHRKTSIQLEQPTKAHRQQRQNPKAMAIASLPPATSNETPALKNKDNANSKKRAKNRKAGLQSLLAAGQSQKNKSLSLSDFMR
ncbi:RNAse P rpr2/Rpp21/SNM1 subunit domain-containing protein [Sarocladium implicatum]|nr:RNAse P rpr2/Rpp21/SNM1 subunit domain-containing protein [Sarocladium implicatum]